MWEHFTCSKIFAKKMIVQILQNSTKLLNDSREKFDEVQSSVSFPSTDAFESDFALDSAETK